jgi:hypothetical protein
MMNTTRPLPKQTLLPRLPHGLCHEQPRCVGHIPASEITPLAGWNHVGFRVPQCVVDPIQGHPKRGLPAVATRFSHRFLNKRQVEVVHPTSLTVSLSAVVQDCACHIVSTMSLRDEPDATLVLLVVGGVLDGHVYELP